MSGMRTTVIFGGAGFVGRVLVAALAESSTSRLLVVDPSPFVPLPEMSAAAMTRVTAVTERSILNCSAVQNAETVVVLAGQTDVDEALRRPGKAFRENLAIAVDAAEWLRLNPTARLIYLSSDEVLGVSAQPLDESVGLRPTQPYAASKAASETTLDCYARTYGLDLVVLRSCNLVGAHQRARKLIPVSVEHLATGRSVPIYGSGEAIREWMSVEDLRDAIIMAAERRLPAGTYHCTSSYRMNSLEVVRLVAEVMECEPRFEHVADRLVHDATYAMSSALIRSFGWEARRNVKSAIEIAVRGMHAAQQAGLDLSKAGV
jgi:dTDP-glucose 4,6-dehydratase